MTTCNRYKPNKVLNFRNAAKIVDCPQAVLIGFLVKLDWIYRSPQGIRATRKGMSKGCVTERPFSRSKYSGRQALITGKGLAVLQGNLDYEEPV